MDIDQAISDTSKKQRGLLLVIVVGLIILAGVWTAIWLEKRQPQVQEGSENPAAIITQITLAGLRTAQEEGKEDPALKQQNNYHTGEPLALRITTAESVKEAIQISVRLLDKGGGIQELSPSSLEFQPGTSTFCCWHISEAGDYTLQIFRPERTVTTVPIKIQGVVSTQKPFS